MLGAIAGDIIGSVHENRPAPPDGFPLFVKRSKFTDDTVLTVAVAECLLRDRDYAEAFRRFYRQYPRAGYGHMFSAWARDPERGPYDSYGNGSAMRVSPVAYARDTLEEVLREAERSAAVTHDHPEGVKGAQAVAGSVFLARDGRGKDDIRSFVEEELGYDLSGSTAELRGTYTFDSTCQGSVPQALLAFLESDDYEDAIRRAISIGGDSDTIACIAGSVAFAFHGVMPPHILEGSVERLDERLLGITADFCRRYLPAETLG